MSMAAVSTLAGGGGNAGYQDGTGTNARFDMPYGVALDKAGNVYVAEYNNNSIRKISTTGVVTNFAGSLYGAVSGATNGNGTNAKFYNPIHLALDSAGNVYVADYGNHLIRKISTTGDVSTLSGSTSGYADGIGTAAKFNGPAGVTTDASGNVYVADSGNHAIRKIAWDTGAVTTLVKTAMNSPLNSPRGVAVDASGNIYIINGGGHTILKIPYGGSIFTLAGSGSQAFANGQGTAASFAFPVGGALDILGNLYVADCYNNRIRMVSPTGYVTTIAGSGQGYANGPASSAAFSNPTGVAINSSGVIYVGDIGNAAIRFITALNPPSNGYTFPSVAVASKGGGIRKRGKKASQKKRRSRR